MLKTLRYWQLRSDNPLSLAKSWNSGPNRDIDFPLTSGGSQWKSPHRTASQAHCPSRTTWTMNNSIGYPGT
ncbi:hypothetical protein F01_400129 [Burkholderia cenocepacia]|nr:hypothetical protein F01_400129 [Burkholderia cenocepacia]